MMGYRRDLWEIAASRNGVVTVVEAEDAGVPAVEVRVVSNEIGEADRSRWNIPGAIERLHAVLEALLDAAAQR